MMHGQTKIKFTSDKVCKNTSPLEARHSNDELQNTVFDWFYQQNKKIWGEDIYL